MLALRWLWTCKYSCFWMLQGKCRKWQLNGIIKADVGNIWMLQSLLCKAIKSLFSVLMAALQLFRKLTTYHLHSHIFQHELRGIVSILSYNLLIGRKGKKCIQFLLNGYFLAVQQWALSAHSKILSVRKSQQNCYLSMYWVNCQVQVSGSARTDTKRDHIPVLQIARLAYKGIIITFHFYKFILLNTVFTVLS